MTLRRRPTGGSGKARVYGRPAPAVPVERRALLVAYRRLRLRHLAPLALTVVGVFTAVTYTLGGNPSIGAGITAAVLAAGHAAIKQTRIAATVTVLAVYGAALLPMVSMLYSAARGPIATFFTGTVTMAAASVLIALLAHRTSRGRPWVTTALALTAVTAVGPLLLAAWPVLGFFAAYLVAGAVLFLRGGGPAWLADQWESLKEAVARRRGEALETVTAWTRGTDGQQRTAALLADLDDRHVVLHDLALPGTDATVHHVVLGPAGVFVIDTQTLTGHVREHPQRGLEHNGQPLLDTLSTAAWRARRVAEELQLAGTQTQSLVVVHSAVLPQDRTRVALFDERGERYGDVLVVTPTALATEIDGLGIEVLSAAQITRYTRRARRRLVPAGSGGLKPTAAAPTSAETCTEISVLDEDGNPKVFPVPDQAAQADDTTSGPLPLLRSTEVDRRVEIGQKVVMLTDQGSFSGVRVSGEAQTYEDGIVYVLLCSEADWRALQQDGQAVTAYPYPLASVTPA